MSELGGKCVFACDIDIDDSYRKTYSRNYGLVPVGGITKVDEKDIPHHDVLCAGFPCQAFSKAGNRLGFADKTKGTLFFDVVRILKYQRPPYALLENVRNLASHDGGNTWKVIYDSLNDVGYNVLAEPIIFSPHYIGIPQHRDLGKTEEDKREILMEAYQETSPIPYWVFTYTTKFCRLDPNPYKIAISDIPNIEVRRCQTCVYCPLARSVLEFAFWQYVC